MKQVRSAVLSHAFIVAQFDGSRRGKKGLESSRHKNERAYFGVERGRKSCVLRLLIGRKKEKEKNGKMIEGMSKKQKVSAQQTNR